MKFHHRSTTVAAICIVLLFGLASAPGQNSVDKDKGEALLENEGFESFEEFETLDESELVEGSEEDKPALEHRGFRMALIALGFTVLAGFLVRSRRLRPTRAVLLLASLAVLGFWNGGCPCPISSFQNLVLFLQGVDVKTHSLIWFLALVPITYVFGRVWCGWICHLGALQEFVHKPNRLAFLHGEGARKAMRVTRYVLFFSLLAQLALTKENLFIHVNPFKVAFNMRSFYLSGWILLGILLVSSLYVYRPFCRSACPVGLMLGWVGRLPFASKLALNDDCRTCKLCSKACPAEAVTTAHQQIQIRHEDCFACGSCMDACRRDSISFERKGGVDDDTSKPHHLDPGSVFVPSNKVNGRSGMRQPSGGASGAGEGRVGAFVGDGTDRPTRLPGS